MSSMRLRRYAKKNKDKMTNEEKAKILATEFSNWVEKCETLEDYYSISQIYIEGKLLKMAKWKEHQIIKILRDMELEDDDIEDYSNEYQCSPNYGFSEKFIKRLRQYIEEYEE